MKPATWFSANSWLLLLSLFSITRLATSTFTTIQLTDKFAVARQNVFFSSQWGCPAPTLWRTQVCPTSGVMYTALNCFDGLPSTFCQTDVQNVTSTPMFVIDLQEPRMITRVGLMTRADCCQTREDRARVLLSTNEVTPANLVAATDCLNPGGNFGPSVYRNYSCIGSAPARFVYVVAFCTSFPCQPINPAEITVWGYSQTYPPVYSRVSFLNQTSRMSSAYPTCGTPQGCAWAAINGIISFTDYAHTNQSTPLSSYVWGMWDTGTNTTSIDRVFIAGRNYFNPNCEPLWHREQNTEVAVTNDTVSLANALATPASLRCIVSLGGAASGGNLNQGLVAPWNWYGGDCNRLGRYMWLRKVGGNVSSKCDGYSPASNNIESANVFNFAELQAWTSSCPSLYNLVNSSSTTLSNLTTPGCGALGLRANATARTGSRCFQRCASGASPQRGGTTGAVECRAGEWVSAVGLATGPIVCGAVCPAVISPSADPTQCFQTVANVSWTSPTLTGTILDWYPTWKVYKALSASAMSLNEMEGRAIATSNRFLTLIGTASVFGLNEPLWAAAPQPSQFQAVSADIQTSSNSSIAGLSLRINSTTEPVTFYALTLLQLAPGSTSINISKYIVGKPTVVSTQSVSLCAILSPNWARVDFKVTGSILTVSCNGATISNVSDAFPLRTGTAGLFHTPNPTAITALNASASAIPAGSGARFRNVIITRGCDGPSGGCNVSLPGETCNMGCPPLTAPANASSLVLTCGLSGMWNGAELVCLPTPSMSTSPSSTQTSSLTPSITASQSRSGSHSGTHSQSSTTSSTGTPSPSSSTTATSSQIPSFSDNHSATSTQYSTGSTSASTSATITETPTLSNSQRSSYTRAPTPISASQTPSQTHSPLLTADLTLTQSASYTNAVPSNPTGSVNDSLSVPGGQNANVSTGLNPLVIGGVSSAVTVLLVCIFAAWVAHRRCIAKSILESSPASPSRTGKQRRGSIVFDAQSPDPALAIHKEVFNPMRPERTSRMNSLASQPQAVLTVAAHSQLMSTLPASKRCHELLHEGRDEDANSGAPSPHSSPSPAERQMSQERQDGGFLQPAEMREKISLLPTLSRLASTRNTADTRRHPAREVDSPPRFNSSRESPSNPSPSNASANARSSPATPDLRRAASEKHARATPLAFKERPSDSVGQSSSEPEPFASSSLSSSAPQATAVASYSVDAKAVVPQTFQERQRAWFAHPSDVVQPNSNTAPTLPHAPSVVRPLPTAASTATEKKASRAAPQSFQDRQRAWFAHPSDAVQPSTNIVPALGHASASAAKPLPLTASSVVDKKAATAVHASASAAKSLPHIASSPVDKKAASAVPQTFQERQRAWFAHPADAVQCSTNTVPSLGHASASAAKPVPHTASSPVDKEAARAVPQTFQERQRAWFAHPADAASSSASNTSDVAAALKESQVSSRVAIGNRAASLPPPLPRSTSTSGSNVRRPAPPRPLTFQERQRAWFAHPDDTKA